MNTKPFALVVATLLLSAAVSPALAITYKTLDYPGSTSTTALGISGNKIVGVYQSPASVFYQSFVYDGTTYTPLTNPLATNGLSAYAIEGNDIAGEYADSQHYHSFLYDGSSYTVYDGPPGTTEIGDLGISGNNLVGYYRNGTHIDHGFLYNDLTRAFTALDDPQGTHGTDPGGMQGNIIVGQYTDSSDTNHGFIYDLSSAIWATLDHPLGTTGTFASGIDGNDIVGSYTDSSNTSHGFIYDNDNGMWMTKLDDPSAGPLGTAAIAIFGNNVVGSYTDPAGIVHGFVATVSEPGDYNGDGVVDAADYVVWRKGLGTTYTQADYNVWRAHFGQSTGGGVGASTNAAVPEPSNLMLTAFALIAAVFGVRRSSAPNNIRRLVLVF